MHHQKYANIFENTVLYGSNYWQWLNYTPQKWGGAKKRKVSKQNYFCVGGKESKVSFYKEPVPVVILILITYLIAQLNEWQGLG